MGPLGRELGQVAFIIVIKSLQWINSIIDAIYCLESVFRCEGGVGCMRDLAYFNAQDKKRLDPTNWISKKENRRDSVAKFP